MRIARVPSVTLAALLALVHTAESQAQRPGSPPFDGPRGAYTFELSDGEPVSFYLEWSRELDLTDDQRVRLIEVRRKLRVQNAPFMRQLDSLREAAGVDMSERARIGERDLEALRRFEAWAQPVMDSIRLNNDGARGDLRTILAPSQLARADSVRKEMAELRARRGPPRRPRSDDSRRLPGVGPAAARE